MAKAYLLFTVAKAEGPEIDNGALSRWLSAAVLFPVALLPNENLAWEYVAKIPPDYFFRTKMSQLTLLSILAIKARLSGWSPTDIAQTPEISKNGACTISYMQITMVSRCRLRLEQSGISPRKISIMRVSGLRLQILTRNRID